MPTTAVTQVSAPLPPTAEGILLSQTQLTIIMFGLVVLIIFWRLLPDILKGVWAKMREGDEMRFKALESKVSVIERLDATLQAMRDEVKDTKRAVDSLKIDTDRWQHDMQKVLEGQRKDLLEKLELAERQIRSDTQRSLAEVVRLEDGRKRKG